MPRLKLRSEHVVTIAEILSKRKEATLIEFTNMLCGYLVKPFGEEYDIDSLKNEAVSKAEKSKRILQAQIELFDAEHDGIPMEPAEINSYLDMKKRLAEVEFVLQSIHRQAEELIAIELLVPVLYRKSHEKDLFKSYDTDPHYTMSQEEIQEGYEGLDNPHLT